MYRFSYVYFLNHLNDWMLSRDVYTTTTKTVLTEKGLLKLLNIYKGYKVFQNDPRLLMKITRQDR